MADISIGTTGWQADIPLTPDGDVLLVDGLDESNQRVARRLLTPPLDLLFHPPYGAGLPQKIGEPLSEVSILGVVRAQIRAEATVAPSPSAQIIVRETSPGSGASVVNVHYWDAASGAPQLLSFDLTP